MTVSALMIIATAACGVGVGILSALMGVGGGTIVIPALRLLFGVDGLVATGTSLFVILPTSIAGVIGRARTGSIDIKLGVVIGAGGLCLSPVGSWVSELAGGTATMIVAAIVIAYTAVSMVVKMLRGADGRAPGDKVPLNARNVAAALAIGAAAGFMSGFIGLGGGFLIVPLAMWALGLGFKYASGTSLMAICILSVPGIITHAMLGHVDFLLGALFAIGSIPGALLGAFLNKRLPERILRIVFGVFLLVTAVALFVGEL